MSRSPSYATRTADSTSTSALVAAIFSDTGGARQLLKLGEAAVITLWVGPSVLAELDAVLEHKSPGSRPGLALPLDRAGVQIGPSPDSVTQTRAETIILYAPDAHIVAEALAADADYLVSLDRQHLVGNPQAEHMPFPVGTPGDCLAWLRAQ
ncbi:MAG: PIN domain-containing protein [Anaerolineae bacterium]|nr:PIN domain-containing protein [Anaerolineae bacterium]